MSIVVSLFVLSLLIFFHELGHFLAARSLGVKVEVFSIGFGSRIFAKRWGDTEYRLAMIPLGGYVQMKGQDDSDPTKRSLDPDSYNALTPLGRIAILFAGPFANFLIAFVFYVIVSWMGSLALSTTVGEVVKDSPAEKAGLLQNDKIIAINGENVRMWGEIGEKIQASGGNSIDLTVERSGQPRMVYLTPEYKEAQNIFGETVQRMMIGVVASGETVTMHYGFLEGFGVAWDKTVEASTLIITGVEKLLTGVVSVDNVGGVVSIVDYTAKATEAGLVSLLLLAALLSVNFGVLNLLPIPALDGGHILFNLYEMLTRRAPSDRVLYALTLGGWVVLGSLMLLGLYNDITRIAAG